jgi:hypothetical protein
MPGRQVTISKLAISGFDISSDILAHQKAFHEGYEGFSMPRER